MSGPLSTLGSCKGSRCLVRKPGAPQLLAFQSLDSVRWTPDGIRIGGRQPGLDLALRQARELTASPFSPGAPEWFPAQILSAQVWAVGAGACMGDSNTGGGDRRRSGVGAGALPV